MNIITAYIAQFLWIILLLTNLFGHPGQGNTGDGEFQTSDPKGGIRTEDIDKASLERYREYFGARETYPYSTIAMNQSRKSATPAEEDPVDVENKTPETYAGTEKGETPETEAKGGKEQPQEPVARGERKAPEAAPPQASEPPAVKKGFNQIVLDMIQTYKGGRYPYLMSNDYANYNGVTENIYYDGNLLLKAHPSGNKASHCVGITFEVFFKAMQEWNRRQGRNTDRIGNLSYAQMHDFMLQWYVASGSKSQGNLTTALEQYGLGRRITDLNAAQPGDFIDLSRENNTGHTVIFLGWIWDGGQITGLHYWSSQSSTGGISEKTEYFNVCRKDGTKYGNVMIDKLYIGRVTP